MEKLSMRIYLDLSLVFFFRSFFILLVENFLQIRTIQSHDPLIFPRKDSHGITLDKLLL